MMKRRKLLIALCTGIAAWPLAVQAQQPGKVPRIGFLSWGSLASGPDSYRDAFLQGLRERGLIEGQNFAIEYRSAEGRRDRLLDLAAELVRLKVDVIITSTTPAIQAARQATSTIPIVMAVAGDPVGTGLVASLARPGGNITGLTLLAPELAGKRLELLKETLPKLTRVAVLWNSSSTAMIHTFREAQVAAQALSLKHQSMEVQGDPSDFERAFLAITRERPDGLFVTLDPFTSLHRRRIVELAAANRLPAMYELREFVDAGGLMAYGPSILDMWRRSATFVDKILKGAKPADLPIEQPTKFELVVNLKTAETLGIKIPQSILLRADRVID